VAVPQAGGEAKAADRAGDPPIDRRTESKIRERYLMENGTVQN
jgi:hypothetical protein